MLFSATTGKSAGRRQRLPALSGCAAPHELPAVGRALKSSSLSNGQRDGNAPRHGTLVMTYIGVVFQKSGRISGIENV
jgi:hypothetical protein